MNASIVLYSLPILDPSCESTTKSNTWNSILDGKTYVLYQWQWLYCEYCKQNWIYIWPTYSFKLFKSWFHGEFVFRLIRTFMKHTQKYFKLKIKLGVKVAYWYILQTLILLYYFSYYSNYFFQSFLRTFMKLTSTTNYFHTKVKVAYWYILPTLILLQGLHTTTHHLFLLFNLWENSLTKVPTYFRKSSISIVLALFPSNSIFSKTETTFSFMSRLSGMACNIT